MKKTLTTLTVLLTVAAFTASVAQAQTPTDVTFFDGGYSEMCSAAAKAADQPGSMQITGSRLGVPPLEICNLAIKNDQPTAELLAGNYNNRGVLYFAQGSLENAMKDFDEAVRINPSLGQAHVNRGYALSAMQRFADSIPAFTRGIELGTTELAKAHYSRGIANEEVGNVREAYYDYTRASELDPLWDAPKNELSRFSVTRK